MSFSSKPLLAGSAGLSSFLSSQPSQPARLQQLVQRDRRQARQQQLWEGASDEEDDSAAAAAAGVEQRDGVRGRDSDGGSSDEEGSDERKGWQSHRRTEEDDEDEDEDEDGEDDAGQYGGGGRPSQLSGRGRGERRGRGSTRDWERIAMDRLRQQHSIDADEERPDQQQSQLGTAPGSEQGRERGEMQGRVLGKRRRDDGKVATVDGGSEGNGSGRPTVEGGSDGTAAAASHASALRQLFDKQEGEQFESFDARDSTVRPTAAVSGPVEPQDETESDPWLQQIDESGKRQAKRQAATAEAAAGTAASAQPDSVADSGATVPRPPARTARPAAFSLLPFNADTAKLLIMQRLRADDETPQAALRRLAGSNGHSVPLSGSAKEASKKKNQRTKPSKSSQQQLNSTQPLQQRQQQQHRDTEQLDQPMDGLDGADSDNKAIFSFLTDLCAQCVREGMYDVYGLTRRQLAASIAPSQQPNQRPAVHDTLSHSRLAGNDEDDETAEYVVKASEQSSVVLGPFKASQLQQQQQQQYADTDAVYRKVGHSRWLPLSQF